MLPLTTLLLIATSVGQTFGVSAFNPSVRGALNLSHSQLTGSYLLACLLAAVPMPLIGWLIDHVGLRRTGLGVVILLGVACMAMSQATGIVTLTLGFWLLRTFGQGALSLVAQNTLAMWFSRRLGLASGIAGLGMSAAFAVIPPAYVWLIHQYDWRTAYVALGVGNWLLLIPLILLFFRDRPLEAASHPGNGNQDTGHVSSTIHDTGGPGFDLRAAWRTRSYWIVMLIGATWGMIGTAIVFNILPYFASKGLTEAEATGTFTTFAMSMAAMLVIGGVMADRLPLHWLLAVSSAGLLGGVLTLWTMHSVWTAHLYALQFGASQGLLVAVGNTLWPRYFGRQHLGKIRSSVWSVTVAACSLGPFAMGLSIDYLESYGPSLALFAGLLVAATLAALFATPPRHSQAGTIPDDV